MARISFSPEDRSRADFYRLMIDSIQPRPIALVSTMSARGEANLAPFSFFMGVGSDPPALAFSVATPRPPATSKDTLANIEETRQFVVAVVTESNMHRASQASWEYPRGVSEFQEAGFASFPALRVGALCVADSPVNFECELMNVLRTGDRPGSGTIVVGRIVHAHFEESVLTPDGRRADPSLLALVGRMGGEDYCLTRERVRIPRPTSPNPRQEPQP